MAPTENLEAFCNELLEVLNRAGPDCGSLRAKVQQEAEQAQQSAKERIAAHLKLKEEEAQRMKEKEAVTDQLLQELSALITTAEGIVTDLKEQAKPVLEGPLEVAALEKASEGFNEALGKVRAACKACTDFLISKRPVMEEAKTVAAETKQKLLPLQQKIHEAMKQIAQSVNGVQAKIDLAAKKEKATKLLEQRQALFKRYDADNDGMLSAKEIAAYAKGEFQFDVPKAVVEKLMSLYGNGGKGVLQAEMIRVRTAVGIAREEAAVKSRKEEAEKRKAQIEAEKQALQGKLDLASKTVDGLEDGVAELETATKDLPSEASATSELKASLTKGDDAHNAAKASVASAKAEVQELEKTECSEELKSFLQAAVKTLTQKLDAFNGRLSRSSAALTKLRDATKKKDCSELLTFHADVVTALRKHAQKTGLKGEEVFKAVDKDGDGEVSEADFLAFISGCEEKAEGLNEDSLRRFFADEADKESMKLSKETVLRLAKVYYKVAAATAITADLILKDSTTIRMLAVGEVFASDEAPQRDEEADVTRVRGRALKDDAEGFASIAGNQGTTFLVEGADVFKVLRAVDLTNSFTFEGCQAVRKLKEGELVQVLEWEKKEEQSGAMRMKAKAQLDGAVGWVTSAGVDGKLFVQPAC